MDILRWPHSRSDQSTSIADYNTCLDMLFSILSSRWFIDIQYNGQVAASMTDYQHPGRLLEFPLYLQIHSYSGFWTYEA